MESPSTGARRVGQLHLFYLSLIPAAGTFSLLAWYRLPFNLVFFIVGAAAVGIYLAVENGYAPLGQTVLGALWRLLDGPLWALLGALWGYGSVRSTLVSGMLIEMAAVLLGLFAVTLSPMVPRGSRLVSVAAAVVPLGGVAAAGIFYAQREPHRSVQLLLIVVGVLEGAWVQRGRIGRDQLVRKDPRWLIVGLVAWLLSTLGATAFVYWPSS